MIPMTRQDVFQKGVRYNECIFSGVTRRLSKQGKEEHHHECSCFHQCPRAGCTGKAPFAGHVRVQGNRIQEVLPIDAPLLGGPDADIVDGAGYTLMPGLTEAHAHPSFAKISSLHALGEIPPEEHTLITARNAKLMLDQGFTSLNSAASGKPRLYIVIRNAINAGELPGPRILAASPELTTTGGLGDPSLMHMHRDTFAVVLDGPEEFRRYARLMCREGVDTIKINPSGDEFAPPAAPKTVMTEAEVAAIVELQARATRASGPCAGRRVGKDVRAARVDLINHATFTDDEAVDMMEAKEIGSLSCRRSA